ncbi:Set3 complex subunit with deacetylase activity, meiotic-specific repressor of sporulation proteins [Agyrium rufum]|nr:Set3 complex subunit with deacetylase activity, meiotic-specific repressor of sporulation proteins [Agyrium rufum]
MNTQSDRAVEADWNIPSETKGVSIEPPQAYRSSSTKSLVSGPLTSTTAQNGHHQPEDTVEVVMSDEQRSNPHTSSDSSVEDRSESHNLPNGTDKLKSVVIERQHNADERTILGEVGNTRLDKAQKSQPETQDTEMKDGDSRSDSEAETVVPSGKDDIAEQTDGKVYRHGDGEGSNPTKTTTNEVEKDQSALPNKESPVNAQEASIASGKPPTVFTSTNNSSNLSSTASSPALESHSPKSPVINPSKVRASPEAEPHSRKRKRRGFSDAAEQRDRRSSSHNHSSIRVKKDEDGHVGLKLHNRDGSKARSSSPHLHTRKASSHGNDMHAPLRRKRPPPPLPITHRKASEDTHGESDDSNHLRTKSHTSRLASAEYNAMSPAKTPHRKHVDKNGRTLLARACANDEYDNALARYNERPKDIDLADNAGNTPLQIASLEGHVAIVRLLIKKGCKLDCRNTDLDTPLIDAVENGHLEVVKLLLEAGLDPRQGNAKGEEPLELVQLDQDHHQEIKALLVEAKEKNVKRRLSDDQQAPATTSRDDESVSDSRGSPTLQSARSPPVPATLSRRRTARSEATRNDVLWMHASPESLKEKAGKGDVEAVGHILNVGTSVNVEAVLVAARGGHRDVLELLIAMGQPDPDPHPVRSSEYKTGHNTPMLAAIGKGNVDIVSLLLNQAGFDPTRRLLRDMTYPEISKERKGLNWEEEYKMLEEAYSKAKGHKSLSRSPRDSRDKKSQRSEQTSSAKSSIGKTRPPESLGQDSKIRKERKVQGGRRDTNSDERPPRINGKHLDVPGRRSRDSSTVSTDRDTSHTNSSPRSKLPLQRSANDRLNHEDDPPKPRRKLISGKEFRSGQEQRRRASLVSNVSSNSSLEARRVAVKNEPEKSNLNSVPVETQSPSSPSAEPTKPPKKRSHPSLSLDNVKSEDDHRSTPTDPILKKKKKRRRMDADGNAVEDKRAIENPMISTSETPNGVASPADMSEVKSSDMAGTSAGPAPVAVMGGAVAPPAPMARIMPNDLGLPNLPKQNGKSARGVTSTINTAKKPPSEPDTKNELIAESKGHQTANGYVASTNEDENMKQEKERLLEAELKEKAARAEAERLSNIAKEEDDRKAREAAAAEAARIAREEEVARQEAARIALEEEVAREEAARLARIAREEEAARQEEQRKIEEAERIARIEREEVEAEKERQRREEEAIRRRADQERLRREQEERKRAEQEEHERMLRIRKQVEEERKRRDALPAGLRRVADKPMRAKETHEVQRWLPLFTGTSEEVGGLCDGESKDEKWILNVQAASILALMDLDLSQYTAWEKRPTTADHRRRLWNVLRNMLAYVEPTPFGRPDDNAVTIADSEANVKFFGMERIFWIRLSDFLDIAARFSHLNSIKMREAPVYLPLPVPPPVKEPLTALVVSVPADAADINAVNALSVNANSGIVLNSELVLPPTAPAAPLSPPSPTPLNPMPPSAPLAMRTNIARGDALTNGIGGGLPNGYH